MIAAVDRVTGSLPLSPVSMCEHLNQHSVPLPYPPWQMWNLTLSESWPAQRIQPLACTWGKCVFPISVWNSIEYTRLCLHGLMHTRLFVHAVRLLGVCAHVCVGVHGFNNHVCSRGALECLSTQGAKDVPWQVCVWRTQWPAEQQRAGAQCTHSGLEGDNRDIAGLLWGGGGGGVGHLGATFHCDYKERHNYNWTNTVMGCVAPCWVAVYWYVTGLACRPFLSLD